MEYDKLIKQIATGDMPALEQLYNSMYSDVFAFTLSIVRNQAAALDLTQDTFLQVYAGAKTFLSSGNGRAWVLTVARNLALNHLKKQKRELTNDLPVYLDTDGNPYEQTEASLMLDTLFQKLDVVEREILMLKAKGYTHKEIASVVNKPEGTVRWKYADAMKKLQLAAV